MESVQLSDDELTWLRALLKGGGQIMPEEIAKKLEEAGLIERRIIGEAPNTRQVLIIRPARRRSVN
ncbi:hypothetical protein [Rhizobium halophytocola]|uniref:Uncharacterized protein n=1 Tax=Rhizobium halophytocola TaxID=735519 RepID=A0ABS4E2D1_9HYPH|nr:hypothetical protein [Rhizobium halophytocola]MBP1852105.1 hypothetical protein [Rhizobium halophytocola]